MECNKLFKGTWIQGKPCDYGEEDEKYYMENPNILLKNKFSVSKIKRSTLKIAGLGYYIVYINNQRISDDELNNDWTDYTKCVYYEEYDVSKFLIEGNNEIVIELGNGMYNPAPLRLFGKYNLRERLSEIGDPKIICDLYVDNDVILSSNQNWKYSYGPYLFNNLYLGETIDNNFIDTHLHDVVTSDKDYNFVRSFIEKIKKSNEVSPITINEYKDGIFVDFGEMISGFIDLEVNAKLNQTITMHYSEHFNNNEFDYSTSLAGSVGEHMEDFFVPGGRGAPKFAIQTDRIICKPGLNKFINKFTYHSFRYVYIKGCDIQSIKSIKAIYVHTNLLEVGKVSSDNAELNELYEVALRTKLNNVHSVFEDCCRERLAYGGDIVALAKSNLYTFDLRKMYRKVIRDFRYGQTEKGGVPETAPYMGIQSNGTGQGEGPLLWQLVYPYLVNKHYQFYGDISVLMDELPFLTKQMDYLLSIPLDEICHKCLGDHGSVLIAGQFRVPTPDKIFLGYCTVLLFLKNNIKIRKILNEEYQLYQNCYEKIKMIIIEKFLNEDGSFGEGTQTGFAFAVYLELTEPKELCKKFVNKIKKDHGIFNSGIFGMALTYEILNQYGYDEVIEQWLLSKDKNTYLDMLSNGNKALAELFLSDHLSLNHAMFSSYTQWYYQGLAGILIDEDAVGFNKVTFKPYFSKEVSHFKADLKTIQGLISSSWKRRDNSIEWVLQIPQELIDYHIDLSNYKIINSTDNGNIRRYILEE